ncbi:MAG TPA: copper resistance protein CopC [Rugosimonospora sp.]|nr:copper resistance protein CopC [Rugosimonospora sp.]
MRRAAAGLLLGVVAVLGGLALTGTPAQAHAGLVRTSPAQGSVVQTAPTQILITFSEHVSPVDAKIRVISPQSKDIESGQPSVSGAVLRIPVRADVPHGTYLVSYRVISADSHPVGAGFTYSVGAPSSTGTPSGASANAGSTDRSVAIGMAAAQYLGYAGLVLIAGPALMLYAFWPQRLSRSGPTRLAYLGIGAAWLATVLELHLQVPYSIGGGLFTTSAHDLGDVLASRYGVLHLVRLGILLAAAFLLGPHLAGRSGNARRTLLILLGVAGVATYSMSGHPGASSAPALTVIADAAHLISASIWLGGLVVLFGYLLRKANGKELGAILPVWSNWAMMAVAVLVLAGTAQALVEIGDVNALLHTTYGLLVLLKVGVLALVVAVAAFSRRLAARKPGAQTVRRLRASVLLEVAGIVVILGLASALVQTAPAKTVTTAVTQQQAGPFSVTLSSSLYQLQIDIDPAKTGDNELHLFAYTPAGAPLKVVQWTGSAALPAQNVEPISISLLALTDSHATGQIALPSAGNWQFSFTLRTTDIDEATVTTTVKIG